MDNRRQNSSSTTNKTYRKKTYYDKRDEQSSNYKGGYKSRNNRFQDKNRYSKGEDRNQSRNNRFNPKSRFNDKKGRGEPPWKREDLPKIVSDYQITDGKHRGKYLKKVESAKSRITIRGIREVLLRILNRRVRAGKFLDLCAGSGTVGLEAISRGALLCTFVERKTRMCSFIRENMKSLGINEGHGEIFETEVVPFLKKMSKRRRYWDVVYYNPPFDTDYDEVLKYFERGVSVKPGGILVIEHHAEMFFPERIGVLKRWRVIVKGDSTISFYDRVS